MTENEKLTLIIAVYAAFVSTIVFIWDVIKWSKSGARLNVSVAYEMMKIGRSFFDAGDSRYVQVTVVNRGQRPTTITTLGVTFYTSKWNAMFRKNNPERSMFVDDSSLPHKLEPGDTWTGLVNQDEDIVYMIQQGTLYVTVYHSDSDNGVMVLIKPRK